MLWTATESLNWSFGYKFTNKRINIKKIKIRKPKKNKWANHELEENGHNTWSRFEWRFANVDKKVEDIIFKQIVLIAV